jgi:hypothetical protein
MPKSRDPLDLSPHWHVDCRLEGELPEDTVVGTRFLINAVFGSAAIILMLLIGWLAYQSFSLRYQIRDWDKRISDYKAEVGDLQIKQGEYRAEADKIDQAYPLMKPPLFVSGFVAHLGQTLPAPMSVDVIESNDSRVAVRGSVRETSERASRILSDYVNLLRADAQFAASFRADKPISLTGLERNKNNDDLQNFEITFYFKPPVQ